MTLLFPLIPTKNLSDLSSASTARTNLGLGTIATQAASAVAITGGTITGLTNLTATQTFTNWGTQWLQRNLANNSCTTNAANYLLAFDMDCSNQTISAGVTDTGYRMAVRGDAYSALTAFAGTLTGQYGVLGRVGFAAGTSGAVITSAFAARFEVLNAVAGTTITNAYGVYIANAEAVGTITNRYGIYQQGTSAINYFDGTITCVGQLTLGIASNTQGSLRLYGSGGANAHTIRAATIPAAANTYVWPSADPGASTVLTASAPSAGVVTLTWASSGASQTPWTGNIDAAGFTLTGGGNITMSGQAARTFGSVRHTTSNTAGNSLTINAGGATSGATDKAGGALTIAAAIGTGSAATSQFNIQAPAHGGSTGTTDQTLVNRIVGTKTVALTSGAAATVATLTVASGSMSGGTLFYEVEATNGTDYIACNGCVNFSVVNKAGTYTWGTSTVTEATNQVTAKSAIANMITNTITGSSGSLQFTSTMSGAPAMTPTTFRVTVTVITNSAQAITL